MILKKHLPEWKLIDELLLDSEAISELVEIVKLQDQWIKHRASSLYIDPMLLELKLRLLSRDELADSLVKCWHPVAQVDQLTPRGLEKAFLYWRDLVPFSERFKDTFTAGKGPGEIDYDTLLGMEIFTRQQFESRLGTIRQELDESSAKDAFVDYRQFIGRETFEETALRAYLVAFLVTDGGAGLRVDPLTEEISLFPLREKPSGETKSVAIEVERGGSA